jgi:hypothetical protein
MATATSTETFGSAATIGLDDVRIARGALKTEIKVDTTEIRAAKRNLRELQQAEGKTGGSQTDQERLQILREGKGSASVMSHLYQQRQTARARLALYAFLRGRTWAQFEPNHAEECKISLRIFGLWKKLAAVYPGLEAPETLRAVCPAKWFEVNA